MFDRSHLSLTDKMPEREWESHRLPRRTLGWLSQNGAIYYGVEQRKLGWLFTTH